MMVSLMLNLKKTLWLMVCHLKLADEIAEAEFSKKGTMCNALHKNLQVISGLIRLNKSHLV